MPVAFYMDVHIPLAITEQLRLRGVDVLTSIEDGARGRPDEGILSRATELRRIVFTHDIRFRAMAEQWIREGTAFAGLAYGHAEGASIGQYVKDLEIIAKASDQSEWFNTVVYLPL